MLTIMLIDDHPVVRRGIRALLEAEPDFQVVGEAGDGYEGIRMVERLRPRILLLDLTMKGISGIEVTRQVSKSYPSTAIIIFSVHSGDHYVLEALRAGARGYILKESPSGELIQAIREVADGHRYLSASILDRTIDIVVRVGDTDTLDPLSPLTAREREVLKLSIQGNTSAEIAEQLYVSRRTVETQRTSAMHKLGLKNQYELITYAIQKGILAAEPSN